jgi:hypothetical protein
MSSLKVAFQIGHPPTAVIFSDPSHKEWTVWDYRLLKAYQICLDWYRDGIPVWWDESERVDFEAKPRISKSRAAIEQAQEDARSNNNKGIPGRYYVAEPVLVEGDEMPTRAEWLEEQERMHAKTPIFSKYGRLDDDTNEIVQ